MNTVSNTLSLQDWKAQYVEFKNSCSDTKRDVTAKLWNENQTLSFAPRHFIVSGPLKYKELYAVC